MVYEVNLLNASHLELDVSGVKLGDWILQDRNNGVLERVSESIFVWVVQAESLNAINEKFGKLGLLLSWKATATKASTKRIP